MGDTIMYGNPRFARVPKLPIDRLVIACDLRQGLFQVLATFARGDLENTIELANISLEMEYDDIDDSGMIDIGFKIPIQFPNSERTRLNGTAIELDQND